MSERGIALEGIKNYLIDMDGVLLRGVTLIAGAAEFVQHLRDQGIPFGSRPPASLVFAQTAW
jgi:beta-phosphoglucomutase-like phosphatase (HAD superfamily)